MDSIKFNLHFFFLNSIGKDRKTFAVFLHLHLISNVWQIDFGIARFLHLISSMNELRGSICWLVKHDHKERKNTERIWIMIVPVMLVNASVYFQFENGALSVSQQPMGPKFFLCLLILWRISVAFFPFKLDDFILSCQRKNTERKKKEIFYEKWMVGKGHKNHIYIYIFKNPALNP